MPIQGQCLKIRFSVTQQLAVVSNDIQCGPTQTAPDLAVFKPEVDALFGGQLLNLSRQIYALTEEEKIANLDNCVQRYSRVAVSGTYWKASDPTEQIGFYLAGLGNWVSPNAIKAYILAHARMRDDDPPDTVFVGAFKFVE